MLVLLEHFYNEEYPVKHIAKKKRLNVFDVCITRKLIEVHLNSRKQISLSCKVLECNYVHDIL